MGQDLDTSLEKVHTWKINIRKETQHHMPVGITD